MIRRQIAVTGHGVKRARERFAYLAAMPRRTLLRILVCAAVHGDVIGGHVLVDQHFVRCRLPDGQPLILIVADRIDAGRPVRVVISVLRQDQLDACGTWCPSTAA